MTEQAKPLPLAITNAALAALLPIAGVVYLTLIVPRFEQTFQDYGVELPHLTQTMIDASRSITGDNPSQSGLTGIVLTGVFVVFGLTAGVGAGIATYTGRASGRITVLTVLLLVWLIALSVMVLAIWGPYHGIDRGLSAG